MGNATRESGLVSGSWDEDIVLFHCPRCEGHYFMSTGVDAAPKDRTKWTGVCEGCGFEWPRAQDFRHFKRMLIRAFTSAEDFEATLPKDDVPATFSSVESAEDELTEAERAGLDIFVPKIVRILTAREARLGAFENDVHYYVGKLDRIDAMAAAWSREGEPKEAASDDEDDRSGMSERECGEALSDVLGGYRERVARLRKAGWTLPKKKDGDES